MTALDQAFIKAYSNQGAGLPTVSPAAPRVTLPLSEALAHSAAPKPVVWSAKVTLESLLAGLEPPGVEDASSDGCLHSLRADSDVAASSFAPYDASDLPRAGDVPFVEDPSLPVEESQPLEESPRADEPPAVATASPVEEQPPDLLPTSDVPAWHPMLQVDHFVWPKVCQRLNAQAAGPMKQLAENLAVLASQGKKIIGIGSCAQGEGVTTLVLSVGRRLVEQGLRVVLADANLADPQLAGRLGLLPQVGWEDTLAGRLPLEEVLVESLADRLVILPVCGPTAGSDSAADETRMAASLDTLASHHDVVLVDLGSLEDPAPVSGALGRAMGTRIDSVVLVHNVRLTTPDRLADVQRCLTAAAIPQAGVVENFVAA